MLARNFGGLVGSSRLEQSRQAKAIAEAGLARTIEVLNRNYNYLLTNCYSQSGSAPPPTIASTPAPGAAHRCPHPSALMQLKTEPQF